MKTHDLFELAALDALGLLEEHEREAFDRAFIAAPPALQAQIRREQTRLSQDQSLLPDVEAPLGLKAKVLAAWRDAVYAARSSRRFLPPLVPASGVTPLWRMGAVAAAAASIVLGFGFITIRTSFNEYTAVSSRLSASEAMRQAFGDNFEGQLFSPEVRTVHFAPTQNFAGQAVMNVDARNSTGTLIWTEFPAVAGEYQVVLTDKDGEPVVKTDGSPTVLTSFKCTTSAHSYSHLKITIKVEQIDDGYGLAIQSPPDHDGERKIVLRTVGLSQKS